MGNAPMWRVFRANRHIGPSACRHPGGTQKGPLMLKVLADVGVQPDATGMPGAAFIQTLLNWLSQVALWGSLGSLLAGAAVYGVSQHTGNYAGGFRGKQLAVAGAVGAALAGIAPTAVNLLFHAAGG